METVETIFARISELASEVQRLVDRARSLAESHPVSIQAETKSGKRTAVLAALRVPEIAALSNRQIARMLKVSHSFVGNMRDIVETSTGNVSSQPETSSTWLETNSRFASNQVETTSREMETGISKEVETTSTVETNTGFVSTLPETNSALETKGRFVSNKMETFPHSTEYCTTENSRVVIPVVGVQGGKQNPVSGNQSTPDALLKDQVRIDFATVEPYASALADVSPSLTVEDRSREILKFCERNRFPRFGGLLNWLRRAEEYSKSKSARSGGRRESPEEESPRNSVGLSPEELKVIDYNGQQQRLQLAEVEWSEAVASAGALAAEKLSESEKTVALLEIRTELFAGDFAHIYKRMPPDGLSETVWNLLIRRLGEAKCGSFDSWVKKQEQVA